MPDEAARQRRLTHRPLLSSDDLITLLEENVEDYAIIIMDPERRIINWNRGAEHILGYSVEEVIGRDSTLIFTPEDRSRSVPEQEFQRAVESGRAVDERYHIRKDGSLFWGSGVVTALRDNDGRVRGAVKIMRDLTAQKQLEESLRQQTQAAEEERARAERERERADVSAREVAQLNALLRRAMAEAHHRIKNSFQMLSALLDVQNENAAVSNIPLDYRKLALHLHALSAIHDLLTEEAKTAAGFDTLSSRAFLERLLQLIRTTLPNTNLQADIVDMPLSLKQGTALAPVINELVTNAVKYGQGKVQVTFTAENAAARLEVTDDGGGFPADFDPQKAAHTGLELIETLARHDLGGEVRYENTRTGGACVRLTFPVQTPGRLA